ncbi:MAG: Zn-ribbon domain-containing OB-fold protein [Bacillota bacterium]
MCENKEKFNLVKPAVIRDAGTAKFFEGAARGRLMLQHCAACGKYSFTGGRFCPHCLAPTEWVPACGRGVLYTWAINHQLTHPAFATEIPYLFGTVELEEGPLIVTRLVDLNREDLHIGLHVCVRFISNEHVEPLPVFGPD